MEKWFTSEVVQAVVKQLRTNKKNAGRENIKAELLKYGSENIATEIATIYNENRKNWRTPK